MEQTNLTQKQKGNKTLTNLVIDLVFLLAFLVVIEERATGNMLHEWLGVGILAFIMVHVLLHWQWVVATSKGFLRKLKAKPRLDYGIDLLIFIGFITIIFSGLMMSKSVLPSLGLSVERSGFWKPLHSQATNATIMLAALHLGLHWKWFVGLFRKYIAEPLQRSFRKNQGQAAQTETLVRDI